MGPQGEAPASFGAPRVRGAVVGLGGASFGSFVVGWDGSGLAGDVTVGVGASLARQVRRPFVRPFGSQAHGAGLAMTRNRGAVSS